MKFLILLFALAMQAAQFGPSKGALVIVGGGAIGPEIWKRYMDLAGGPDAPVVFVPTASEREPNEKTGDALRKAGFRDVTVLHTRDKKVADTEDFVAPLKRAKAVFFEGGRQWRIVDSYAGTKTEKEFAKVLARGGVIGGTSAGATIQGSYLARGAVSGNEVMMSPGHEVGFGYFRNVAIDQHLLTRKRENDLWQIIDAHPKLLGIGLDEATAIVVQQDEFTVIGPSKVAIYDHKHKPAAGETRHYWLKAGDRFDIKSRKKIN